VDVVVMKEKNVLAKMIVNVVVVKGKNVLAMMIANVIRENVIVSIKK
jgi:hypothetical protein